MHFFPMFVIVCPHAVFVNFPSDSAILIAALPLASAWVVPSPAPIDIVKVLRPVRVRCHPPELVNVRPCIVGVYRLHPAVFVVIPDGAIVFDDNVSDTCWRVRRATVEPATIWQPDGHIMVPIFADGQTILPDFDRAAVV